MPNTRIPLTILAIAAGLASGCGGDADGRPAAGSRPAAEPGLTMPAYEQEVGAIIRTVNDARSEYFHGTNAKAVVRRTADGVRAAYREAVVQLKAIDPPKVAVDYQQRLVALWHKRADQLSRMLDGQRLNRARISDLLYSTDHDGSMYDELYALQPY